MSRDLVLVVGGRSRGWQARVGMPCSDFVSLLRGWHGSTFQPLLTTKDFDDLSGRDHMSWMVVQSNSRVLGSASDLQPLYKTEALLGLGWLAIELRRSDVARGYFERAQRIDPGNAEVEAGLGSADRLDDRWGMRRLLSSAHLPATRRLRSEHCLRWGVEEGVC